MAKLQILCFFMRCICFSMRTWRCFFLFVGLWLAGSYPKHFQDNYAAIRWSACALEADSTECYAESCRSSSAWYRIAMQRTQNRRTKVIGLESSHTSRHVCDDVQKWLGKPSRSVATRLWQQMLPVAAASLYYACEGSMSCSRSTCS